jgi:hypothetical protein
MLPLGHIGPNPGDGGLPRDTNLTHDEQVTMMTLWCMFQSPLIMGGDLLSSDEWTMKLLTNPEVLAVDQHASGRRSVVTTENTVVWISTPEDGRGNYVAVFNLSDKEQTLAYGWTKLDLPKGAYSIRDLWNSKDLGDTSALKVTLRPHASALYRVIPKPTK